MDENFDSTENEELDDELEDRIVLTDEDGNEITFQFLDTVAVDEKQYMVLLPLEEAESGEVVIFEMVLDEESDEVEYRSVNEEEEAEKVFQAFKEKTKDLYDFAD